MALITQQADGRRKKKMGEQRGQRLRSASSGRQIYISPAEGNWQSAPKVAASWSLNQLAGAVTIRVVRTGNTWLGCIQERCWQKRTKLLITKAGRQVNVLLKKQTHFVGTAGNVSIQSTRKKCECHHIHIAFNPLYVHYVLL